MQRSDQWDQKRRTEAPESLFRSILLQQSTLLVQYQDWYILYIQCTDPVYQVAPLKKTLQHQG